MSFSKYARLATVEESEETLLEAKRRTVRDRGKLSTLKTSLAVAVGLIVFTLALSAAFVAGKHSVAVLPTSHAIQFDSVPHIFHYNRSFSEVPNNHTNHAWRELFPKEGGFFVNTEIAPQRSTFHVFHTLHCLNHIRQSYWLNHHAAVRGQRLGDDEVHIDFQPSHVRHCIDLIRQSLMCQADTTLEVVDESINGVHGFRTEHICTDWEQLRDWTSEQQMEQHVEQIE